MHVTYRQMPPMAVFYARGTGRYASTCRAAWQRIAVARSNVGASASSRPSASSTTTPRTTAPGSFATTPVPVVCCAGLQRRRVSAARRSPAGPSPSTPMSAATRNRYAVRPLNSEIVPKRALTVDYERPFVAVYLSGPQITREMRRRTELCIPVIRSPCLRHDDEGQEGYDVAESRGASPAGAARAVDYLIKCRADPRQLANGYLTSVIWVAAPGHICIQWHRCSRLTSRDSSSSRSPADSGTGSRPETGSADGPR